MILAGTNYCKPITRLSYIQSFPAHYISFPSSTSSRVHIHVYLSVPPCFLIFLSLPVSPHLHLGDISLTPHAIVEGATLNTLATTIWISQACHVVPQPEECTVGIRGSRHLDSSRLPRLRSVPSNAVMFGHLWWSLIILLVFTGFRIKLWELGGTSQHPC